MQPIYVISYGYSKLGVFYDESEAFMFAKTMAETLVNDSCLGKIYKTTMLHKIIQQGEIRLCQESAQIIWENGKVIKNRYGNLSQQLYT